MNVSSRCNVVYGDVFADDARRLCNSSPFERERAQYSPPSHHPTPHITRSTFRPFARAATDYGSRKYLAICTSFLVSPHFS